MKLNELPKDREIIHPKSQLKMKISKDGKQLLKLGGNPYQGISNIWIAVTFDDIHLDELNDDQWQLYK